MYVLTKVFLYPVSCQSCDPSRFFQCLDNGSCILVDLRCDDVPDCPDHSDEFECRGNQLIAIFLYNSQLAIYHMAIM